MTPTLAKLLAALKTRYPQYAVHVRRCRMPRGLAGQCYKYKDGWRIDLDSKMDEPSTLAWATHEFAHVPSWPEWERTGKHGRSWSWHYKCCYNIYERIVTEANEIK